MYKILLRLFFFVYGILLAGLLQAQDSLQHEKPQMADGMRANGKIYVVVSVLLIILTGLFVYLVRLDKKMSRLEKNSK
jgi:CcmD family protein